jgi:hypothetical protein
LLMMMMIVILLNDGGLEKQLQWKARNWHE